MPVSMPAPAAFEEFFARTYSDVARFCARRCASPEDAEEAATAVFAVAWRRWDEVPAPPEDRLWLFGVARRVLANEERGRRRRSRLLARLASEPAPPPASLALSLGESDAARALRSLRPADRELLLLNAWEDLAVVEIARVLGVSAPVVSRRLHRARARFRAALAGERAAGGHVSGEPSADSGALL